jgi:hypothetical protein
MTGSAEGFDDDISTPDEISERLVMGEAELPSAEISTASGSEQVLING